MRSCQTSTRCAIDDHSGHHRRSSKRKQSRLAAWQSHGVDRCRAGTAAGTVHSGPPVAALPVIACWFIRLRVLSAIAVALALAFGSRRAVTTARSVLSGVGRLFGVGLEALSRLRVQRFLPARSAPCLSLTLPTARLEGDSTAALTSPDPIRFVGGADSRDVRRICL